MMDNAGDVFDPSDVEADPGKANRFSIQDDDRAGWTWDYFDPSSLVCSMRGDGDEHADDDEEGDVLYEADRFELDRRPDWARDRWLDEYSQFSAAARQRRWS